MSDLSTNAALNSLLDLLQSNTVDYGNNQAINAILDLINQNTGQAASFGDLVFVQQRSDFGTPVAKKITLQSGKTYFLTGFIDLIGDRLITNGPVTIIGGSSETCGITSFGLTAGTPLITTSYTLSLQNLTIYDVDRALSITGDSTTALDWEGVNFLNVNTVGTINGCGNFVFTKGAFLNSQTLTFTGSISTIAFESSLFSSANSGLTILSLDKFLTLSRRFRIIYSSFVVPASDSGIYVDSLASIPTESYILDSVNFSGAGLYLNGITHTSNESLFTKCKGITNTSVNGQMYMQGNTTDTVVSVKDAFYKVLGTTTASTDNAKYTHSNNRLTNDAVIERKYLIQCNLSFESGSNNVCTFGFYDSKLGAVRTPSRTKSTANSAGKAENVSFNCVVSHKQGDYIEIHCANNTGTTNIKVTEMNVVITELN